MRLKGKKTIVTGGGGANGIGRAIVRAFGSEGADVCITGLNQEAGEQAADEVRQCGGQALWIKCDNAKLEDIESAVNTVLDRWDCIDVLVNNAGAASLRAFLEVTPEEAHMIWNINVFGTYFMEQKVAQHMVERARQLTYRVGDPIVGKIINISSISEKVGTAMLSHYAPTKAAIGMITKCTALELAPYGILVNAIGVGVIRTDIVREDIKDLGAAAYDEAIAAIPLKCTGLASDVGSAAVFLASNDSNYMTGTTMMVDGGYTAQ